MIERYTIAAFSFFAALIFSEIIFGDLHLIARGVAFLLGLAIHIRYLAQLEKRTDIIFKENEELKKRIEDLEEAAK